MTEATQPGVSGEPSPPRVLTVREAKFVEYYCQTQCIRTAATLAGMGKGNSLPYRVFREPHIQAAIRDNNDYILGLLGVTTARILREQAAIGFLDPRTIVDDVGNILPFKQWPDEAAAALQGMDVVISYGPDGEDGPQKTVIAKPRFHSKATALEAMMKHLGMFEEHNKQTGAAAGDALGEALTESMAAATEKLRSYAGTPQTPAP